MHDVGLEGRHVAVHPARRQRALEREARRLGMVKAGEKAYVVRVP